MFKNFLINEDFKTAKIKWLNNTTEEQWGHNLSGYINTAIDLFKKMKEAHIINPPDNDIDKWANGKFSKFNDFVTQKNKEWEKKKNQQNLIKYNKTKVKKVFENENAIVLVPLTPEASEGLAHINGTNHWCIATRGAKQWWYNYIGTQGLTPYYVFFKNEDEIGKWNKELVKVAVMIKTNDKIDSIWNRADTDIKKDGYSIKGTSFKKEFSIVEILKRYGIPVDTFKSLVKETEEESEMPQSAIDEIINNFEFDWDTHIDDVEYVFKSSVIMNYIKKLKAQYTKRKTPEEEQINTDEMIENAIDSGLTEGFHRHFHDWIGFHVLTDWEEDILDDMFRIVNNRVERAYESAYESALENEIEYQKDNWEGVKYTLD